MAAKSAPFPMSKSRSCSASWMLAMIIGFSPGIFRTLHINDLLSVAYTHASGSSARFGHTDHAPVLERLSPSSVGYLGGTMLYLYGSALDSWDHSLRVELGFQTPPGKITWRECPVDWRRGDPFDKFIACTLPPVPDIDLFSEESVSVVVQIQSIFNGDIHTTFCDSCYLTYSMALTPRGNALHHAPLRGVSGDTVALSVTNWHLKTEDIIVSDSVLCTIGGESAIIDGHSSFIRTLNATTILLHVIIPEGLTAGFYPLMVTLERNGHDDESAQGRVIFEHNDFVTVEVVPAVTDVYPQAVHVGETVTIIGSGFAQMEFDTARNDVILPGNQHGCVVLASTTGRITCVVTNVHDKQTNLQIARRSLHELRNTLTGFQLTVVPHDIGCGHKISIDAVKKCVAAVPDAQTDVVTITNELLWPSLHPLRHAAGAFRQDVFVAHGSAMFSPPCGVFSLRMRCSVFNQAEDIGLHACEAKIRSEDGDVVLLGSDKDEYTFDEGRDCAIAYQVEVTISHSIHGQQFELAYKQPGHNYYPVPSAWFTPMLNATTSTAKACPEEAVTIGVDGLSSSICRSSGNYISDVDLNTGDARYSKDSSFRPRCGVNVLMGVKTPTFLLPDSFTNRNNNGIIAVKAPSVTRAHERKRRRAAGEHLWSHIKETIPVQTATSQVQPPVVVPAGETWWLDVNMDVAGLIVYGILKWDTRVSDIALRADYILVEGAGQFHVGSAEDPMILPATIHIKTSSQEHKHLGKKFIGGFKGLSPELLPGKTESERLTLTGSANHISTTAPVIRMFGKPRARLSTTLCETAEAGARQLFLVHNPIEMGWEVGDEIAITSSQWTGNPADNKHGTQTTIASMGTDYVNLTAPLHITTLGGYVNNGFGDTFHVAADVMNLQRTVTITTDRDGVVADRSTGVQTIMFGGELQIQSVRIENCGQTGVLGAYCFHMHLIGHCPSCQITGNAVVEGTNKGITIHGTHDTLVSENTVWNLGGVGLYIEDGNELNNTLLRNVVACTSVYYCKTILGEKNGDVMGMYVFSLTNHIIENRFSNQYITALISSSGLGQGVAWGRVKPVHSPIGTMRGNIDYCGVRFGWYFGDNYPRNIQRDSEGFISNPASTKQYTVVGADNGIRSVFKDHFSWNNHFVGGYGFGDFQFDGFTATMNLNNLYWKESKNFGDGDYPHLLNCTFFGGYALGPAGPFTFFIEDSRFVNSGIAAGQHCGLSFFQDGLHDPRCIPQYVFKNTLLQNLDAQLFKFGASGGNPVLPTFSQVEGDDSMNIGPLKATVPATYGSVCAAGRPVCSPDQQGPQPINIHKFDPGHAGGWGGTCTCPNGNVYQVGDVGGHCSSLACYGGGIPGKCGPINPGGNGMVATCAASGCSPTGSLSRCDSVCSNCRNTHRVVCTTSLCWEIDECAVDSTYHEVRCCADTKPSDSDAVWHAKDGDCPAFVASHVSPNGDGCVHSATFNEARIICAAAGGRLCTDTEVKTQCTAGTGCQHDYDRVWTSSGPLAGRYNDCWTSGSMEENDANCEAPLVCARSGYDGRDFGDCDVQHCCSLPPQESSTTITSHSITSEGSVVNISSTISPENLCECTSGWAYISSMNSTSVFWFGPIRVENVIECSFEAFGFLDPNPTAFKTCRCGTSEPVLHDIQRADDSATTVVSKHLDGFSMLPECMPQQTRYEDGYACNMKVRRLIIWSRRDQGDLLIRGPGYDVVSNDYPPSYGQNAGRIKYSRSSRAYFVNLIAGKDYNLTIPSTLDVVMVYSDPIFGGPMFPHTIDSVRISINGAEECTLSSSDCRMFMGGKSPLWPQNNGYGSCGAVLHELAVGEDPVLSTLAAVSSSAVTEEYRPNQNAPDSLCRKFKDASYFAQEMFTADLAIDGLIDHNRQWRPSPTDETPELVFSLKHTAVISVVDIYWNSAVTAYERCDAETKTKELPKYPDSPTFKLWGRAGDTASWDLLKSSAVTLNLVTPTRKQVFIDYSGKIDRLKITIAGRPVGITEIVVHGKSDVPLATSDTKSAPPPLVTGPYIISDCVSPSIIVTPIQGNQTLARCKTICSATASCDAINHYGCKGSSDTCSGICNLAKSPLACKNSTHPVVCTTSLCGEIDECAVDSTYHEVRCCADTKPSDSDAVWHAKDGDCPAFVASHVSPNGDGCVHSATFNEARIICAAAGGRLCTDTEVKTQCTAGTGCQHDYDRVWTSSSSVSVVHGLLDNDCVPPSNAISYIRNGEVATLVNAKTSYENQLSLSANKAIDGRQDTRWSSNRGPSNYPQLHEATKCGGYSTCKVDPFEDWISVELNETGDLLSLGILWETAMPAMFGVFVKGASLTNEWVFNSNHTTLRMSPKKHQTVVFNPTVRAKSIKIVSYSLMTSYGISIWELTVLTKETSSPTVPTVTTMKSTSPTTTPTTTVVQYPWEKPCHDRPWSRASASFGAEVTFAGVESVPDSKAQALELEFDNVLQFTPTFTFYWSHINPGSVNSTVKMALRCSLQACPGWIGIGFSNTGSMIGSHAIIGECPLPTFGTPVVAKDADAAVLGTVDETIDSASIIDDSSVTGFTDSKELTDGVKFTEYYPGGKSIEKVKALNVSSLSDESCTLDSTHRLLRFTRPRTTADFTIQPDDPHVPIQHVLFAFGAHNTLGFHLAMGIKSWPNDEQPENDDEEPENDDVSEDARDAHVAASVTGLVAGISGGCTVLIVVGLLKLRAGRRSQALLVATSAVKSTQFNTEYDSVGSAIVERF